MRRLPCPEKPIRYSMFSEDWTVVSAPYSML